MWTYLSMTWLILIWLIWLIDRFDLIDLIWLIWFDWLKLIDCFDLIFTDTAGETDADSAYRESLWNNLLIEMTEVFLIGFVHEVFWKNCHKHMSKEVGQTVGFSSSKTLVTVTGVDSVQNIWEKALTKTLGFFSMHLILGKYSSIQYLYCMVCRVLTLTWHVDSTGSNARLTLNELNWFDYQFYLSNSHKFCKWTI